MSKSPKPGGAAVFDNWSLARKPFASHGDNGETEGSFAGYSKCAFETGGALNLSFSGGWSAEGVGGDYVVLSGTGGLEGATGTGRFTILESPWNNADYAEGHFTLMLPD